MREGDPVIEVRLLEGDVPLGTLSAAAFLAASRPDGTVKLNGTWYQLRRTRRASDELGPLDDPITRVAWVEPVAGDRRG